MGSYQFDIVRHVTPIYLFSDYIIDNYFRKYFYGTRKGHTEETLIAWYFNTRIHEQNNEGDKIYVTVFSL